MFHQAFRIKVYAAGISVALCGGAVSAQEPSSQSSRDARRAEIESRQRALWTLEKEARKNRNKPRMATANNPAFQQFKEDYEGMQTANYALADLVAAAEPFDYRQIGKQASEVKKRAARLRTTLVLPEAEKQEKPDEKPALKDAVAKLGLLVQEFISNPMFQELTVLDATHTVKARRDLDEIVRLSEHIRKTSEALNKK
jgi:hypothetical protein